MKYVTLAAGEYHTWEDLEGARRHALHNTRHGRATYIFELVESVTPITTVHTENHRPIRGLALEATE